MMGIVLHVRNLAMTILLHSRRISMFWYLFVVYSLSWERNEYVCLDRMRSTDRYACLLFMYDIYDRVLQISFLPRKIANSNLHEMSFLSFKDLFCPQRIFLHSTVYTETGDGAPKTRSSCPISIGTLLEKTNWRMENGATRERIDGDYVES